MRVRVSGNDAFCVANFLGFEVTQRFSYSLSVVMSLVEQISQPTGIEAVYEINDEVCKSRPDFSLLLGMYVDAIEEGATISAAADIAFMKLKMIQAIRSMDCECMESNSLSFDLDELCEQAHGILNPTDTVAAL